MDTTEELINMAKNLLSDVIDKNFSPEWLGNANTCALIAIAQELKRMNDENENHHENVLLVMQGERFGP